MTAYDGPQYDQHFADLGVMGYTEQQNKTPRRLPSLDHYDFVTPVPDLKALAWVFMQQHDRDECFINIDSIALRGMVTQCLDEMSKSTNVLSLFNSANPNDKVNHLVSIRKYLLHVLGMM